MRKLRFFAIAIMAVFFILWLTSGDFLVVNDPQPADVIVVLAGETNWRPARGLQLFRLKYAPRLLLDVPSNAIIYDQNMLSIAQAHVEKLQSNGAVSICPIAGLSTQAEARDVRACLQPTGARKVLVVTSDYHTRRAVSIFRHEFVGDDVSIAAAFDSQQYGTKWWSHRQWAKTNLDEWLKMVWWQCVDRWR
jgi:uncharacterized SAM-binding protein YcdF (DUF218 family)